MRDGPSSSRCWPEALDSLTVEKKGALAVEEFGGGIVGFRLPEEGAGVPEAPAKAPGSTRRKAAAG